MIRKMSVSGYKSFKDVEVHFQPLSVIFGPNAAGKSNLLDALSLLSGLVTKKNLNKAFEEHRGLPLESFYYSDKGFDKLLETDAAEAHFEVDVELSRRVIEQVEKTIADKRKGIEPEGKPKRRISERFLRYSLTLQILTKTGHLRVLNEQLVALKKTGEQKARKAFLEKVSSSGKERLHLRVEGHQAHPTYYDLGLDYTIASTALYEPHYPHMTAFQRELSTWRFYYFEPRILMREDAPLREVEAIGPRGENLAPFLNTITANDGRQLEAFNHALKYLLPSIERVQVDPTREGFLRLTIIENGLPYSSRVISEGTLRILGLLAALHPSSPATVIGYEEPENGVHPSRLKLVADLFKNTQADYGRQLIINSHSPIFPTYFDDRSLFVCRKERGDTRIIPFRTQGPLFKKQEISKGLEEAILRGDYGS